MQDAYLELAPGKYGSLQTTRKGIRESSFHYFGFFFVALEFLSVALAILSITSGVLSVARITSKINNQRDEVPRLFCFDRLIFGL